MVPGYIEGIYEWDEINIDLIQLSLKYNINIIVAKVLKISSKENKVFLKDRAFRIRFIIYKFRNNF